MASVLLTTTTTTELYHNISMCVNRAQKIFVGAGAGSSESRSNQQPNNMFNKTRSNTVTVRQRI